MNAAVLARTGWRLARRSLWSAGRPRRELLPLVLVLGMLLAFGLTAHALFQMLADAQAPRAWAVRVLGWAFTLALLMLALGNLHVAVAAVVGAPDLERLRTAPISPRQLLALKLFQTLPRTLPPVLGIALPVGLAFSATYGGVNPLAFGCALLALWAVPLGLGSALALPLLRIAPATRLRESLAVLATVAFVAGWLVNAFWMPRLAEGAAGLSAGLRALPAPPAWSPATWAALAVTGAGGMAFAAAIGCLVAASVALALALAAGTRLLDVLQIRAEGAPGRVVRASARRAATLAQAFLRRDAALVARDWPVVLDALANLALWSLLPLAVLPLAPLPRQELARDMVIALSVSLGHDVAARALPLERASLAWARLSPVGGARWVRLRSLGVGGVTLGLQVVATALVSLAFGLRGPAVLDVLVFALAATAAATGTGLCVGALLGDPDWTDPRAMLGAGGRALSAVLLLTQAAVALALAHRLSPAEPLALPQLGLLLLGGALHATLGLVLAAKVVNRREFAGR